MRTRPTLDEVYQGYLDALADSGPPAPGHTGPRGWTVTSTATQIVSPFVTYLPTGPQDIAYFHGLDADAASQLLEHLSDLQLADRQHDAPSLGTLLRAATAHPGVIELHGYMVGPSRPDVRITAEGIYVYDRPELVVTPDHQPGCQCAELWEYIQLDLGVDDARWMPDEMRSRVNAWRPDEPCWSLWWE